MVLTSRVATGASFKVGEETLDYGTPRGDFSAILKMPTRHMRAPEAERESSAWFDLPGVPWSTFFTYEGIAIHGTSGTMITACRAVTAASTCRSRWRSTFTSGPNLKRPMRMTLYRVMCRK